MRNFRILLALLFALAFPGYSSAAGFRTVVIDAGHGAHDLGQGVGGVYEKWMALDVSLRLERYLKAKGVKTVMTRRSDVYIGLDQRAALANRYAKDSVFVSVHFNGAKNTDAHGLETFYYNRSGYELAARVHRRKIAALRGVDRGVKFARFHVLRNTKQAAILVEGGFLTNATERKQIATGPYRQALAEAIGQGILDYQAALKKGVAR
ncbi:MAG: N-acetylmuramoyl-L-alanine amidase [Verrucomicrobiales bacterium]